MRIPPRQRGAGARAGLCLLTLLACTIPFQAAAKAILGVDLGSLYMKVALVQRNSPLEIVTNLHSKRRTEQMVLFDQNTRFYGADANSMAARKPDKIPSGMSVMLGREAEHPTVKVGTTLLGGEVTGYFIVVGQKWEYERSWESSSKEVRGRTICVRCDLSLFGRRPAGKQCIFWDV